MLGLLLLSLGPYDFYLRSMAKGSMLRRHGHFEHRGCSSPVVTDYTGQDESLVQIRHGSYQRLDDFPVQQAVYSKKGVWALDLREFLLPLPKPQ